MNGIIIIPSGKLSFKMKEKIKLMNEKRDKRLNDIKEEFKNGKYDYIIYDLKK